MADEDAGGDPRETPVALRAWAWFVDLIAKLVDRFGWPGAFVVLGYAFIQQNATDAQKQRMINTYVLGDGIDRAYPIVFLGLAAGLLFFAQREMYARRQRAMQQEIDRLGAWKSAHQQAHLPVDLNHTGH